MKQQNFIVRHFPKILVISFVGISLVVGFFVKDLFLGEEVKQRKVVQQITVIAPPPPPPPPPPEDIPEPEVEEEVVEEEIEEPTPDDSPDESISEDLGLDAEGEAGTDGFGLKAKKGGRGILGGGNSYKTILTKGIQDCLKKNDRLKLLEYSGIVDIRVSHEGKIENFRFKQESGDEDAAIYIERELSAGCQLSSRPFEASPVYKLRVKNSFTSNAFL